MRDPELRLHEFVLVYGSACPTVKCQLLDSGPMWCMLSQLDSATSKLSPDTEKRVMSCVSHAVGLTSVKATAQWDELQRGLEAVLRVLVSSEYLSLVVFCGQF